MTRIRRGFAAVVAAALALAVLSPSAAIARPWGGWAWQRTPAVSADTTGRALAAAQKREAKLEARIATVLKRRAARYDRVAARLAQRIERVDSLADKIAASGGDVTEARALLGSAKTKLSEATALEAKAAEQFRAVASAGDRKTAFTAARATARSAIEELRGARTELRGAIVKLRSAVAGLKTPSGSI